MAKSNHQPFENWLFLRDTISREEELALQDHLHNCEHCQHLSGAVQSMEYSLKTAPVLAPAAGFSGRWLTRLEENRLRQYRKQTAVFSLAIFVSVILLAVVSIILISPLLRAPIPYLLTVAYQLALLLTFMENLASAGVALYRTLFKILPPAMLFNMFLATCGIVAISIVAIGKFLYPRRVTT
ncbi:MAG: zf-HC2 domain-containing protein [Anaerolineales bacterium]